MIVFARILLPAALMLLVAACGGNRGSYTDDRLAKRDIRAAEACYAEAVAERRDDPEDLAAIEKLLRQALDHDLYHGPAHNDLGVILHAQGKLYAAAQEFEWARKLMPGHPDPRVNLAMVLEQGGKHADSLQAAAAALELRPGYLPAIQAIAWVQLRNGLADTSTAGHLDAIATRSDDPIWRDWALRWQQKRAQR
jgi:tetratricopeptide (TPR) repeat protein